MLHRVSAATTPTYMYTGHARFVRFARVHMGSRVYCRVLSGVGI
jgi:hypothetical protein